LLIFSFCNSSFAEWRSGHSVNTPEVAEFLQSWFDALDFDLKATEQPSVEKALNKIYLPEFLFRDDRVAIFKVFEKEIVTENKFRHWHSSLFERFKKHEIIINEPVIENRGDDWVQIYWTETAKVWFRDIFGTFIDIPGIPVELAVRARIKIVDGKPKFQSYLVLSPYTLSDVYQ